MTDKRDTLPTKDNRKAITARIHIAKKELGLDDETYRAMLQQVTKHSSCADMHISELYRVMEHLKKLGYKPATRKFGKRPNPAKDKAALMGKVEALLADSKLHWNYAHAMAQRMFSVAKVDWLDKDQLWRLVGALEKAAKRS
ncbi:gp16 family protein [Neptunomonas antarctica]|uniref:Mu-like prophage protein gp16 n=1 Tax=Neptunomonas antarctica TaxID=619304 RepID=A0A1N7MQN8_9GAMM|nr:regulatory protein GemA [Neptunomonas antarctica]SIS88179.1 Mu-like prophage protein gp16 [Neptunomonas antarctica]